MAPAKFDSALYRLTDSLRAGLWFIPALFFVGAVLASRVTLAIDRQLHEDGTQLPVRFIGDVDNAQAVLTTISAELMTFTALIFTITIVALQLASSQFSPRVISGFLRDRVTQTCLGVFVATFTYSLLILVGIEPRPDGGSFVPILSMTTAVGLAMLSIATFILYAHRITQHLRVVRILDTVAGAGRREIEDNHNHHSRQPHEDPAGHGPWSPPGEPPRLVRHAGRSGVLASLDVDDLVHEASTAGCVLRLVPGIGDYVGTGYPLFEVYGADETLTAHRLRHHVAFRPERTMRQDVGFALRQLVDVAERALSPAINDPTTAVQAVDRIEELLHLIGSGPLHDGVHIDPAGEVRLVHPAPTWEGYVQLAFTEIRHYGSGSFQVQRRLRAAAVRLTDTVDLSRQGPLTDQMELLDRETERLFPEHDRAWARTADPAGMGVYDR